MAAERSITDEEVNIIHLLSSETGKPPTYRFLKPCTKQLNQAVPIPETPLLSEIFPQKLLHWPSKVSFRGWQSPQQKWKDWFARLRGKYSAVWNQSGIWNAILSSTYSVPVPKNQNLVLGLSEFWCPETNTFVFPWGEATVTLEDIMILGGFPVLGEHIINMSHDDEMLEVVRALEKHRIGMVRSRAKRAEHNVWLNHFMDKESQLEHVAFLSLWLSRYVFPSQSLSVGNYVFPIAVKLSQGTKVSIAPAVLASIYRDLRLLREGAIATQNNIQVWAPFQLLQLWVFEHFSILRSKSPNPLKEGEPRVARWHELRPKADTLNHVRSAFQLAGPFGWRPYAADLVNWRHLSYYGERKQTYLFSDPSLDSDLCSFFKCLSAHEIVGLDCVEDYSPHRVAMQFGLDQDLPSNPLAFKLAHEKVKFDVPPGFEPADENVKFFVPTRSYRGCASERYTKWFKDMMHKRDLAIQSVLKKEKYSKIVQASSLIEAKSDSWIPHIFCTKKEMDEFFETSDDEEQFFGVIKSAATPITNCSIKEETSPVLSDDDNVPIGTLFECKNHMDSEEALIDSDKVFSCTLTTEMVDENNRKRRPISRDGALEGGVKKKPANGAGQEVEEKPEATINVKFETSFSNNEPLDLQPKKEGENLGNCFTEVREKEDAGHGYNPIELDD